MTISYLSLASTSFCWSLPSW